jgi:hypothetical protein
MADPALYTVWVALADALEGIRGDAGYHTTVRTVTTDPLQLETLPAPLTPAIVVVFNEELTTREAESMPEVDGETLVFSLLSRVDDTGLDKVSRIRTYAHLRDDLFRAVRADVTCGGVAWDVSIRGVSGPGLDQGRILARHDVTVRVSVEDSAS